MVPNAIKVVLSRKRKNDIYKRKTLRRVPRKLSCIRFRITAKGDRLRKLD
jgi:hypothetical protein